MLHLDALHHFEEPDPNTLEVARRQYVEFYALRYTVQQHTLLKAHTFGVQKGCKTLNVMLCGVNVKRRSDLFVTLHT